MRRYFAVVVTLCFLLVIVIVPAFAAEKISPKNRAVAPPATMPKAATKGVKVKPGPFRVISVQFQEMSHNNQSFLAAAILFNKDVDPASIQQNVNIRLLKKNENHFWLDASTQNNTVRTIYHGITWASGAPLENGYYVMHLRGTLKSKDGIFLDCDGDGTGEGGALPPYESQIYQVNNPEPGLIDIDPGRIDDLRESIDGGGIRLTPRP